MVLETSLEHRIIAHLESQGWYVIKNQASGTTGRGRPDLSACINGVYVAFEVKRERGSCSTTLAQIDHLRRVARAGGQAFWVKHLDIVSPATRLKLVPEDISLPFDKATLLGTINRYLKRKDVLGISLFPDNRCRIYRKKAERTTTI